MEQGNETDQTGEKSEHLNGLNLIPIGCDHVTRSYSGCSGRKIGAFREYIRTCYLNQPAKFKLQLGSREG